MVVLLAMGAYRAALARALCAGLLFWVRNLLVVRGCGVRAIADRPYRCAEKQLDPRRGATVLAP